MPGVPSAVGAGAVVTVRNAADRAQLDRAKDAQRLREEQERNDWLAVLALPAGRRVLAQLMGECQTLRAVISADAMTAAANEGRRNVGLSILTRVHKLSPDTLAQMLREDTHE